MKVTQSNYNFIQKVIKNLSTSNQNNTIKPKSQNIKEEELTNVNEKDLLYNKEEKRVLGSTDYKKYEQLSKEIELEENKKKVEDTQVDERLKMGCNNDLSKERQLYDKSTSEKIEATKMFKQEGDYFLKMKDLAKAEDCYEKGLLQLFYTFEDNDDEVKEVENLKYSLNMNVAMCKINKSQFKECLGYLSEALKINSKNVKCLYRQAYVYFKLEDFNKAKEIIKLAIVYAKEDSEAEMILGLSSDIKQKEDEIARNSDSFFKKMMSTAASTNSSYK